MAILFINLKELLESLILMIDLKISLNVGYNMVIMRQSACLVVNPITVYSYSFCFNCTTVGQASDSITALTYSFNPFVDA